MGVVMDICNQPGVPPTFPLLERILGHLGSPRGAIQRQGQAQRGPQGLAQGPASTKESPGGICM